MKAECKARLQESTRKVERWVEDHHYKGYEPFDGLSSALRPLTFGKLFLDRLLLQLVRQSPLNLRPLLGIRPLESTKGRGYMASGYLIMYRMTADLSYRERAEGCLGWLIRNKSPKFREYTWANHFDFASRFGRYSKDDPIIVWTALIGQAFLDGYEILGDPEYLAVATSICDWITALPRERTGSGTCISYLAFKQDSVHNANMLGAAILSRTAKYTGNTSYRQLARAAMEYSCSRQLRNGAWYYGEAANLHWIDNFHTGYNLDSLKCYIESSGDEDFRRNLGIGYKFYTDSFFEESGRPKYYHDRTYPVDSQCISQSIETLANFSELEESAMPLGLKVAGWAIRNMQDKDGHFYYRQYPAFKAKTPMLHWAQATMYRGLVLMMSKIQTIRNKT